MVNYHCDQYFEHVQNLIEGRYEVLRIPSLDFWSRGSNILLMNRFMVCFDAWESNNNRFEKWLLWKIYFIKQRYKNALRYLQGIFYWLGRR